MTSAAASAGVYPTLLPILARAALAGAIVGGLAGVAYPLVATGDGPIDFADLGDCLSGTAALLGALAGAAVMVAAVGLVWRLLRRRPGTGVPARAGLAVLLVAVSVATVLEIGTFFATPLLAASAYGLLAGIIVAALTAVSWPTRRGRP